MKQNDSMPSRVLCRERTHDVSAENKIWLLLEQCLFFRATDQIVQKFLKVQSSFVLTVDYIK